LLYDDSINIMPTRFVCVSKTDTEPKTRAPIIIEPFINTISEDT